MVLNGPRELSGFNEQDFRAESESGALAGSFEQMKQTDYFLLLLGLVTHA